MERGRTTMSMPRVRLCAHLSAPLLISRAKRKDDGKNVALKRISVPAMDEKSRAKCMREVRTSCVHALLSPTNPKRETRVSRTKNTKERTP